jgi:hypothetical protein
MCMKLKRLPSKKFGDSRFAQLFVFSLFCRHAPHREPARPSGVVRGRHTTVEVQETPVGTCVLLLQ